MAVTETYDIGDGRTGLYMTLDENNIYAEKYSGLRKSLTWTTEKTPQELMDLATRIFPEHSHLHEVYDQSNGRPHYSTKAPDLTSNLNIVRLNIASPLGTVIWQRPPENIDTIEAAVVYQYENIDERVFALLGKTATAPILASMDEVRASVTNYFHRD